MYERYVPDTDRAKPRGQAEWDAEAEAAALANVRQETAALRPELLGRLCWTESDPHGFILNRRGTITEARSLLATKRRLFRTYLKWVNNQSWCGTHGEKAVYTTFNAGHSSGRYAIATTPANLGNENSVDGYQLPDRRSFDILAYLLDDRYNRCGTLCIEVKNVSEWIHPKSPALWQLLYSAALVAHARPDLRVIPILAAPFAHFQAFAFAADAGFLIWTYNSQLFSPSVDPDEFDTVVGRLGLPAGRHPSEQPLPIREWLRKLVRGRPSQALPHLSLSKDSRDNPPMYERQSERFLVTAQAVLATLNDGAPVGRRLGENRSHNTAKQLFSYFLGRFAAYATWPLNAKWIPKDSQSRLL